MAELFFGDFRFDTRRLILEGPGGDVEVRPKTLELLTYLIENRSRFVARDELMEHLWSDVVVTTSSLTQCISELRHAFDDSARSPKYIETKVKRGYRFVATVYHRPTERLEPLPPPADLKPANKHAARTPRMPILIVAIVAAVALGLGIAWNLTRTNRVEIPRIHVAPLICPHCPDTIVTVCEATRTELGDRLLKSTDINIEPSVSPNTMVIELKCAETSTKDIEIEARLLDISGSTTWGWTWVVPADTRETPPEVTGRIHAAIEARFIYQN